MCDLTVLQAEFSLIQFWDRPVHRRCFFEGATRENIDLGRPEQVQLIFARKMQRNRAMSVQSLGEPLGQAGRSPLKLSGRI
jgi:hypothetical protein